jgi:hypothetical protein
MIIPVAPPSAEPTTTNNPVKAANNNVVFSVFHTIMFILRLPDRYKKTTTAIACRGGLACFAAANPINRGEISRLDD